MSPERHYDPAELLRVYERHPLREETLLARLRRTHPSLEGLTELDLAVDERTGITDQNHIGGYPFVRRLGALLELTPDARVLDVGCGLGGPARVLATLHGCRVHGVDISPARCVAARRLTRLVGLDERVTFECGDFLETDLPPQGYDAIVGQSSLVHFADKRRLVERCSALLVPGGRLAVEDCYLAAKAGDGEVGTAIRRLEEVWLSHFVTLEAWSREERRCRLEPRTHEDLTPAFVDYLRFLIETSPQPPANELEGWRLGAELGAGGHLLYARTLSARAP